MKSSHFVNTFLIMLVALAALACSGINVSFGDSPTPVPVVHTVVYTVVSTNPPATEKPAPTNRPQPTESPTPTSTLPIDVPKPQAGKGVVIGQILKGGIPASGMPVQLCSVYVDSPYGVCGTGAKYRASTDNNGFFIFSQVEPGGYHVLVVLLPDMMITYWEINIDIKAGETQNFGTFDMD